MDAWTHLDLARECFTIDPSNGLIVHNRQKLRTNVRTRYKHISLVFPRTSVPKTNPHTHTQRSDIPNHSGNSSNTTHICLDLQSQQKTHPPYVGSLDWGRSSGKSYIGGTIVMLWLLHRYPFLRFDLASLTLTWYLDQELCRRKMKRVLVRVFCEFIWDFEWRFPNTSCDRG